MPGLEVVFAWPAPLAYIGPGAGLDLLGYAATLLAFGVTALSAVLLWPVYTLLRWVRGGKKPAEPAAPPGEAAPAERPPKA